MGTTLDHGIYLPDEGERNCYDGLAGNWVALDNHLGSTDIHVTINDKQAWNGHIADTDKHVTASDKTTWNTVTSKANDSDVVHKSGDETITGTKTIKGVGLKFVSGFGEYGVASGSASLNFYDKNSLLLSYIKQGMYTSGVSYNQFSISAYDSDNNRIERTITLSSYSNSLATIYLRSDFDNIAYLGTSGNRWARVYATNYYYGNDNVEFSTKFVTTDTAQTISGDKTFSSINGVEPSSLSLPNPSNSVDISSYFSNTGSGDTNSYTASANGWIYLRLGDISSCQVVLNDSSDRILWGTSATGNVEQIIMPILKNTTLTTTWVTNSTVNVATARFIPCQGNV